MSEQPSPNPYWEALSPDQLASFDMSLDIFSKVQESLKEVARVRMINNNPLLRIRYDNRTIKQALWDATNVESRANDLFSAAHSLMPPRSAFSTPQMEDGEQEREQPPGKYNLSLTE
jgi:hypothetical protein